MTDAQSSWLDVKKNDLVRYWFDTGAMGMAPLYGIVVKAGPKTVTIRWESGLTNRVRRDGPKGVTGPIAKDRIDASSLRRLGVPSYTIRRDLEILNDTREKTQLIKKLLKVWQKHPRLHFCQFLVQVIGLADPADVRDEELARWLDSYGAED